MKDFNMDIDLDDFDFDDTFNIDKFPTRYVSPKIGNDLSEYYIYRNAEKLASDIKIKKNSRKFVIINGSFCFGDFIEALIVENDWYCEEMIISTLSMNQNNIDSLANLLNGGFINKLDLILSSYFYSHEKWTLIPYLYKELDKDNKFQLAIAYTHCKTVQFKTSNNKYIVIHGSANLRSSGNIEQIMIEENKELYDFNANYQKSIIDSYSTIKKELKRSELWQKVQESQDQVK